MGKKDPRIDAYIARAPEFSRPILTTLRKWVHEACPEATETIKWGQPHFEYKGIFAGMGSFKAHAVFGFWKGELIFGKTAAEQEAMGQFGRMTSVDDLPTRKQFAGFVKQAMKLNDEGVTSPSRAKSRSKKPKKVVVPAVLAAALRRSPEAKATFDAFPPSKQKEYVEWIEEAKTEETRERRLATAIEWMEEGKPRMWKYARK
jgi:hypothetical protein